MGTGLLRKVDRYPWMRRCPALWKSENRQMILSITSSIGEKFQFPNIVCSIVLEKKSPVGLFEPGALVQFFKVAFFLKRCNEHRETV